MDDLIGGTNSAYDEACLQHCQDHEARSCLQHYEDDDDDALSAGLEIGLAEEGAPVRAARAKLDNLREARELEEARSTAEAAEARLLELQSQEQALVGARHKKERSATRSCKRVAAPARKKQVGQFHTVPSADKDREGDDGNPER
ncbi:unnamed protein product [Symbiodinium natans]|uniref:Uncharacterized protein n=1 Tax=Symbiodinium natans TaxID=878477 RepID=A0A812S4R7_9DINO|nr:unnamed protein product [Symbiodinium natans]